MIVLSCGHEVADFNHTYRIMCKSSDSEGGKAIEYSIVCGPCEDSCRQAGFLFDTEAEATEWLQRESW